MENKERKLTQLMCPYEIIDMIKELPNNQSLGEELRQYYFNMIKFIESTEENP